MRIKKQDNGDTIIEVLICLAILGLVMTLAYTISTRSLQTVRRAQERIEALKIAEGQLEGLKNLQKNNVGNFRAAADLAVDRPFCISSGGTVVNFDIPANHSWNTDIASDPLDYPNGAGECSGLGAGSLYNVAIVPPDNATGGLFKVYVRWVKLGEGSNEQVTLEYYLYDNN